MRQIERNASLWQAMTLAMRVHIVGPEYVNHRCTCPVTPDVLADDVERTRGPIRNRWRHMRCYEQPRRVPQRAVGRQWLRGKRIGSCAGDSALPQCIDECGFIDD